MALEEEKAYPADGVADGNPVFGSNEG